MESYNVVVYPNTRKQFTLNYLAEGGPKGAIKKLRSICMDSGVRFHFLKG